MAQEAGMACDEINVLKAPLITIGVPADIFNEDVYLAAGYLSPSVASDLKLFSAIEQDDLEQVLNIGITNGLFNAISNLNARTFFQFCAFLRTPAGTAALAEVGHQSRFLKELTDAELLKLFDAQGADFASAVIEARLEHEAKIKDLDMQLEQTIEGLKTKYAPYATYKHIIGCDLSTTCWSEFIRSCVERALEYLPPSSPSLNLVVQNYAPTVRNKQMLNYLNELVTIRESWSSMVERPSQV